MVLGVPVSGARTRPPELVKDSSSPLTKMGTESPRLATVLGRLMSVMSRTTIEALPRSVTRARQRLDGAWHKGSWLAVGLLVGLANRVAAGVGLAVGGAPAVLQAAASSAVAATR